MPILAVAWECLVRKESFSPPSPEERRVLRLYSVERQRLCMWEGKIKLARDPWNSGIVQLEAMVFI